MTGLSQQQVMRLVNLYIGVEAGYLGDFSYRTHQEFYSEYCGIDDVDTQTFDGTTRQRFIAILLSRAPQDQAKILRGVITKFGDEDGAAPSRLQLQTEVESWATELERGPSVSVPALTSTRNVVLRALADADTLLKTHGPSSAVDRIHTALHGHLIALCGSEGISLPSDASVTAVMKRLRENHPKLLASGARFAEVTQVLYTMSNVLDKLNTLRNNASLAHPNEVLLGDAEARLAINAGKTVSAFVDEKAGVVNDEPQADSEAQE